MIDLLARALAYLLVPCFFLGMIGSFAVVAFTIVRDFSEALTEDEAVPAPDHSAPTP